VREGISPGFGDDYDPELEGQLVDVTNVPAGRYVLVHRANPERALEESDYENNAASVLLQLRRAGVIPSVRVLARCRDADTCSRSQRD
jgi:Lysyl oxidase